MKHIWIGRWPRQTSVALFNWLGGYFFVYINNKFSWLEQYSGCWGFSVQIPLPAFRPERLIGTRGVLFGNQMSPQSHFWWCEDQPFDHTRTKSTCSKSIISPCRNKSRKPWKTWKNWALQMARWRPCLGLICPSHRLAHVYSFFLRVIVGDANCGESGWHAMKATQKIRVNPWLGFLIYIYVYIHIYTKNIYIHTHIWIHVFWSRLAKCRQEFRRHNCIPLAVIRVVRICVARSTKVWNQLLSCRWALGGTCTVLGKSGRFSVATRETTFLVACHGLNQLVWFAHGFSITGTCCGCFNLDCCEVSVWNLEFQPTFSACN